MKDNDKEIDEKISNESKNSTGNSFDSEDIDKMLEDMLKQPNNDEEKFSSSYVDAQIQRELRNNRILAIGVGGAGSNAINNIMLRGGVIGATTVAINTDARHLLATRAEKKLLIGRELTNGSGAGDDPNIGRAAAMENEEEIRQLVRGYDLVFVACGLGKGTGTGAGPFIARVAQEEGCLVVSVCTLPFISEGRNKMKTALKGLQELRKYSNSIIVVPNEKLLDDPTRTLWEAFAFADEILINAVVGLTELIVMSGRVNVDFADTKKVLRKGGPSVIGIGRGKGENRAIEAITNALSNPLLEVDFSSSTGALVHIKANKNVMMSEVDIIRSMITDQIQPTAEFIWGCKMDESIPEDELQVTVVLAGVKTPFLFEADEISIDTLWKE